MTEPSCLIDGRGPFPLIQPTSVAELGEVVRQAACGNQAVYPVGGQTVVSLGMPPEKLGLAVDVRGLAGVVDYPARDMTITVQAGITLACLQETLAGAKQRLPIDVPCADRATLGGTLAANVSGPRRLGYGTLRDYVLGISAVNDEGQEIKAGGRVVKNVAGYDLCKLFVGSLGTLGILTQVTLKLRPLPQEQALIALPCEADSLERLLNLVHGSRTRPVCLELLNAAAAGYMFQETDLGKSPWFAVIGYEGNGDAVKWQLAQLVRELRGGWRMDARLGKLADPWWHALTEFPTNFPGEDSLTFKASLPPSATADFCSRANALTERPLLAAHAGNGIVKGHAGPGLNQERAARLVQSLRELARPFQGVVIVQHCPPEWKQAVSVWGPPADDVWLMRRVKEQLDPRDLFNPGRFVV